MENIYILITYNNGIMSKVGQYNTYKEAFDIMKNEFLKYVLATMEKYNYSNHAMYLIRQHMILRIDGNEYKDYYDGDIEISYDEGCAYSEQDDECQWRIFTINL